MTTSTLKCHVFKFIFFYPRPLKLGTAQSMLTFQIFMTSSVITEFSKGQLRTSQFSKTFVCLNYSCCRLQTLSCSGIFGVRVPLTLLGQSTDFCVPFSSPGVWRIRSSLKELYSCCLRILQLLFIFLFKTKSKKALIYS